MEWWEIIIKVGAVLTAVIAIVSAVYKYLYKPWRKFLDDFAQMKNHQTWTYHNTLRLMIMSEEMPIEERIAAGDKYVNEEHLNGKVKRTYENLIDRWEHEKDGA